MCAFFNPEILQAAAMKGLTRTGSPRAEATAKFVQLKQRPCVIYVRSLVIVMVGR